MNSLDMNSAVEIGGWDPRYAVPLAVQTGETVAAALIDTNGDGSAIDLDYYIRGADGSWTPYMSGSAQQSGSEWTDQGVAAWGRGAPHGQVVVEYMGVAHSVSASADGWWLFLAVTADPEAVPRPV